MNCSYWKGKGTKMKLIDQQCANLRVLLQDAGASTNDAKAVLHLCPHCYIRLTHYQGESYCPYCSGALHTPILGQIVPGRKIDLEHLTKLDKLYIVGSADAGSPIWCREAYWTEEQYLAVMVILIQNPCSSKRQKEEAFKILSARRSEKAKEIKRDLVKARRAHFDKVRAARELALIERDGYFCTQCGSQTDLTIDHIVPLSKGGTDTLDNLQFLCRSCNSSKNDQLDLEMLDSLDL
jgi:hypothetical protein